MNEPPISINIHGAGMSDKNRQRVFKILEKEMQMSVTPVKAAPATPGWKTTELWVTVLVAIGSGATAAEGSLPPRYAVFAATIAAVAYALSRGLAKR